MKKNIDIDDIEYDDAFLTTPTTAAIAPPLFLQLRPAGPPFIHSCLRFAVIETFASQRPA